MHRYPGVTSLLWLVLTIFIAQVISSSCTPKQTTLGSASGLKYLLHVELAGAVRARVLLEESLSLCPSERAKRIQRAIKIVECSLEDLASEQPVRLVRCVEQPSLLGVVLGLLEECCVASLSGPGRLKPVAPLPQNLLSLCESADAAAPEARDVLSPSICAGQTRRISVKMRPLPAVILVLSVAASEWDSLHAAQCR